MLWFHVPYMFMVYGTSNGPQHDICNYLGVVRWFSVFVAKVEAPVLFVNGDPKQGAPRIW